MKNVRFLFVLAITMLFGCNLDSGSNEKTYFDIKNPYVIDFDQNTHNFTAIFSDYPKSTSQQNNEVFYELSATYDDIPAPLNMHKGIRLVGNNHSDDLLMAIKGRIRGLEENTLYRAEMEVTLATAAPSNCFGIGGAPGESVYVKLGVSEHEPRNIDDNGMYRLNIDLGQQSTSGSEGETVGDLANGRECGTVEQFVMKTLSTTRVFDIQTNEHGMFWIIAATDSGFEGLSEIYFNKLTLTLSK
ncbi:hypothetical protein [Thalassotalea fusca]